MLNLLDQLQIFLEGKLKFLNSLILISLLSTISCNNNGIEKRNNTGQLNNLFLSDQLSYDIEYFVRLNDSIDAIRGSNNDIKNNVYVICFFKCNNLDVVTIDLLAFYNRVLPPGDKYIGHFFYLNKYFIFYQERGAFSLVNYSLLEKKHADSVPDEYSREAILTNNGGDCRSLVYQILPDSQIVLISQNPVNYIRKLDHNTLIFPCD